MTAMQTLPNHMAPTGQVSRQNASKAPMARRQCALPRSGYSSTDLPRLRNALKTHEESGRAPHSFFNPTVSRNSLHVTSAVARTLVGRISASTRSSENGHGKGNGNGSGNGKRDATPAKVPEPAMGRLKIGLYFVTWWALNVVFNIYNKKVLNAFPFPWLTSTLSLLAGSLIMLVSWLLGIVPLPQVDLDFWKTLAPVALAHTIGHVAATVSMAKVAVSFTHIIKSAEPAFSVVIQSLLFGEKFPPSVYLSLLPIVGGCGLAAATELNFNLTGFTGAMISNVAFVFRNIFSKTGMSSGKSVGGINYYACLSMMSLVFLTPFAIVVEGPQNWISGLQVARAAVGPTIYWWIAVQSIFYHLYNQVSYMSLNEISPLTFSIGNTMKRVTVIVSSIIIFHTQVSPINVVGAAIAIAGTFLYSQQTINTNSTKKKQS